ncbi:MAG: hypothetical protein KDB84_07735 [Flavobacteriales bacterium]|nr:hypothetical protein [Flavobacteriales bacterium]
MRNVTLVLFALASSIATAQDYLGNEPIWQVHSICAVPAPCIATDVYNYTLAGDSVINGVLWSKVVRSGMITYNWQASPPAGPGCQGSMQYSAGYHGVWFIRQVGRQLRIWTDDTDELLFDFDLHVNDVLPVTWNNWNTDITVIAVDSVLIGTEMRARFELANSWAQYLVEGVGSSHGLFEPISNFLECGYGLDCFGLGMESYYPETFSGSCQLAMGTADLAREEPLTAYPSPAQDVVRLTGVRSGAVVQIIDPVGREVLHEPYSNGTLDVSSLPAGVYTVIAEGRSLRIPVMR